MGGGEKAKAEEAWALRRLTPDFSDLPMNEAAGRIGASRNIDLGVHPMEDA